MQSAKNNRQLLEGLCKRARSRYTRVVIKFTEDRIPARAPIAGAAVGYLKKYQMQQDTKCRRVVLPEGERDKTQGYQLRSETTPLLLCRFLIIIVVELWEARGDRQGEGLRAWGWGEAHRVRFTLQYCCCAIWTFT